MKVSNIENDFKLIHEMIFQFYKTRNANKISRIVSKYGMDYDDVFQVASISYLRAEKKYKKEMGFKFSTFIGHCIKQEIAKINQHHSQAKRNTSNVNFIHLDYKTDQGQELYELVKVEDHSYEKIEELATLSTLLGELSAEEQSCIINHFLSCKTYLIIADELQLSQNKVRRRIFTGIKKMKNAVNI